MDNTNPLTITIIVTTKQNKTKVHISWDIPYTQSSNFWALEDTTENIFLKNANIVRRYQTVNHQNTMNEF